MHDHHYTAFGMDIHSEFKLALPEADATTPEDWRVEIVKEPIRIFSSLPYNFNNNKNINYGRSDDGIHFDIRTVARFAVQGTSRICCDPYPGSSENMISICITGIILIFLLKQRESFVLHGSAASSTHGALVFIGNRGSGKSTTAAALASHGYRMLCDDIVPISKGPLVMPGVPVPNLLPDAYEKLIGNLANAQDFFNGIDKYHAPLPASMRSEPLIAIFILEKSQDPILRIQQIAGAVKIKAIYDHAIMIEGIEDPVQQFPLFTQFFSGVRVYRIQRPESGHSLDEIVPKILQTARDLATTGGK